MPLVTASPMCVLLQEGRNSVWPHDFRTGWSYCVTVPSWTIIPKGRGLDPTVVYNLLHYTSITGHIWFLVGSYLLFDDSTLNDYLTSVLRSLL